MKTGKAPIADEMRPEYTKMDLGEGVRGKHYREYSAGYDLVTLDPEVAIAFPSEKAVNEALLALFKTAKSSVEVATGAEIS